ncbi:MAG: hypothetical protein Q8K93_10730 [Reyranella sp.]|uniref:hypothetical protein n=1 Tax=Reyranella sp. TaxID=1929291 RepID=UPI00272FA0D7|nr:hypothetical protein [Reyranella sp.]MDP1962661.1 hypothetical protein [Reyranella sp.]MDP2372527.1 hypothetical protein [Reyranella sp.]
MSHTIKLNKELGVIVLRAKRSMDVVEIQAAFNEVVHLPGFKEGLSLVVDFRGSETLITGAETRLLADYAKRADAKCAAKWLFLASSDVTYGLSRMFMALSSQHEVETHVFRNVTDADDWLGVGVEMDEILARTPD